MKFGLIYHMFFPEEINNENLFCDLMPCGCHLTDGYVNNLLRQNQIIGCDSTMEIVSRTGERCCGRDWIIPLSPKMILRNKDLTFEMAAKACNMAQEWGADIIGNRIKMLCPLTLYTDNCYPIQPLIF